MTLHFQMFWNILLLNNHKYFLYLFWSSKGSIYHKDQIIGENNEEITNISDITKIERCYLNVIQALCVKELSSILLNSPYCKKFSWIKKYLKDNRFSRHQISDYLFCQGIKYMKRLYIYIVKSQKYRSVRFHIKKILKMKDNSE